MQKVLLLFGLTALLISSGFTCNKDNTPRINKCLKGKLEIKGICMNYVISVLGGNIDPSLIEGSWQDNSNGNIYQNVFRLANPCSFPTSINEGDEFYFYVVENSPINCLVCMAFRPTPQKSLEIKVSSNPCL